MDWDDADRINPELEDNIEEVMTWSQENHIRISQACCADCDHYWPSHSRGDNGPCVEHTCLCIGFLWAAEYNRPSAPRGQIGGVNVAQIDGYWE